ncbi:MAG: hypothetical protein LBS60_09690 [Deltaproteobacteria bacterium]|jgi:hypothetical protein|nr:hypothetical protein [Deltaproteobacteria bacterium]
MLVKTLTLTALALTVLALAQPNLSRAADIDLETITVEELNKEGPLIQADLDMYVKFFKYFIASMKNTTSTDFEAFMKQIANDFIKASKISPVRLRLITEKIPYALILVQDPDTALKPDNSYMRLSPAELELVKSNFDAINEVISELGQ